jgi:hypothetical protein
MHRWHSLEKHCQKRPTGMLNSTTFSPIYSNHGNIIVCMPSNYSGNLTVCSTIPYDYCITCPLSINYETTPTPLVFQSHCPSKYKMQQHNLPSASEGCGYSAVTISSPMYFQPTGDNTMPVDYSQNSWFQHLKLYIQTDR